MGSISKDFSWHEFEYTVQLDLAADNVIPNDEVRENIRSLVEDVLQPLRDAIGVPLNISSGYRCEAVNERVGGVPTSQHVKGQAADVYVTNQPSYYVAFNVEKLKLPYDQMILYNSFVHLSHKRDGEQRCQLLYDKHYTGQRL
ncbi:MAG: D-Ala-D-Ala carboxypeptidase family metallohydrolase [Bacteroidales bacterium]|nr:D-Ala-D-Ala carboxypeptidase family metallohydrolase [Bacteroidales bacterium]